MTRTIGMILLVAFFATAMPALAQTEGPEPTAEEQMEQKEREMDLEARQAEMEQEERQMHLDARRAEMQHEKDLRELELDARRAAIGRKRRGHKGDGCCGGSVDSTGA